VALAPEYEVLMAADLGTALHILQEARHVDAVGCDIHLGWISRNQAVST